MTSCVQRAASAAPRENSSSESSPATARSWLPARQIAQCSRPARRRRRGRRRSRRGRPGTRSRRARGAATRRAPPRRRGGCRGCRRGSRRACWNIVASVREDGCACRSRSSPPSWWRRRPCSLLRPRDGVIDPAPVSARAYFSPDQIERARDFRARSWRSTAGRWWSRRAAGAARGAPAATAARRRRRPVLAGAAAGAALSVALVVAHAAVRGRSRERAKDVGLVDPAWGGWAGDVAVAGDRRACSRAGGGALADRLMRRFAARWWCPASAVVVASARSSSTPGPLVLDPLFNRFEQLPAGQARSDVLELAAQGGRRRRRGLRGRRQRRTTAANAYVTGLGPTKRVVLYDNLLDGLHARRDAARRRPRARPRPLQRRPARPALPRCSSRRRACSPSPRLTSALAPRARAPAPLALPAALAPALVVDRHRRSCPTSSRAASRRARTPSRCS